MSLTKVSYSMVSGSPLNILDFGADPTGINDSTAAFNAAVAQGTNLYFPLGKYRFNSTLTIDNAVGLNIQGAGAGLQDGVAYSDKNTVFVFDNAPSGSNGLVISNFVGLTLRNIIISQNRGGVGNGSALVLSGGHDFVLENVGVDLNVGSGGTGIALGEGTGTTSVFQGSLQNCKVIANNGAGIFSNASNTSLSFVACYVIRGYYKFKGTIYSSVVSCAADGSPSYGYIIENCVGLTFSSCGSEVCNLGMFYLQSGSNEIVFTSPVGIGNNTSDTINIGDLFTFDSSVGAIQGVSIFNPSALNSRLVTTANIVGLTGTGVVDVYGVIGSQLSKGFGGSSVWRENYLTVTGTIENFAFNPSLNANWTNVGTPQIVATYNKKGKLINYFIQIIPSTSIKANGGAGINIPWTQYVPSTANVVDDNNLAYGTATVNNGIIYLQTMASAITYPLNISGSFVVT